MLFTKASEYALMAVVAIAKSPAPIDVLRLSNELELSRSYLAKVLQMLAKAGILRSYKGTGGGFELAKRGDEIYVMDIVSVVDEGSATVFSCSKAQCDCLNGQEKGIRCTIWPFLNRLQMKVDSVLSATTLEDLVN